MASNATNWVIIGVCSWQKELEKKLFTGDAGSGSMKNPEKPCWISARALIRFLPKLRGTAIPFISGITMMIITYF
jgi:hypothetical protein